MTDDPEFVEHVRQSCAHPVSDEQAASARKKILREAAFLAAIGLAVGWYYWSREGRVSSLLTPVVVVLAAGWSIPVRYRMARPRQAAPVPDDVLGWALREHTRCRACRTIVRRNAIHGPSCGVLLAVSPAFWVALAVGLAAFAALVWWRLP